jgi:hypothetical protein
VLDRELPHRKVPRIAGREAAAERERSRGDETVGLSQGAASLGEPAAPFPRLPTLPHAQRDDSEAREQRPCGVVFPRAKSPDGLLHVDGAHVWEVSPVAKAQEPPPRIRTTAEEVDEHGGVEKERSH